MIPGSATGTDHAFVMELSMSQRQAVTKKMAGVRPGEIQGLTGAGAFESAMRSSCEVRS